MPTITIEGVGKVNVGDEFLNLSADQQNATVDEIIKSVKQPQMGTAEGLYRAADRGVATGVAGLIGLPGTLADNGAKAIGKGVNAVERLLGRPESAPPDLSKRFLPTPQSVGDEIQRRFYDGAAPYEPRNRAEEYARTAGEFLPAAVAGPGGVASRVAQVAIPTVLSETAGQVTKGTPAEPYARAGAGLVGAGITTVASRPSTAARAIREQMPAGVTEQMVGQAEQLIQEAAARGITLTWPEALSQVAGRPVLTNAMRHLEASPQTEARMADVFAGRPQQVDAAARAEFGNIAQAPARPSAVGPAVGSAAEDTINATRQGINTQAEPFYNAASTVRLSPQEMARVRALPGYQEARDAVRNDPQLNRYVANLPDDSVGFLNEVKKYFDQARENATAPVNAQRNMQRAAGYGSDAAALRGQLTQASGDYAGALAIERRGRDQFLQPLLDGPLGKIAGRDTTTREAINALFPANPLPNSEREISRAVGALSNRNARAARDLVRAHVESTFNETSQALQSGANAAGGAKFRSTLVGNEQQARNLEASIRALPNGDQIWPGFERFLDILQATGTRQNIGSRTAYNAELLRNQSASTLAGETAKATANPLRGAQFLADRYERYRLGSNLNELAAILTNPAASNQLRAIARMAVGSRNAEAAAVRAITVINASRESKPVNQPSQ